MNWKEKLNILSYIEWFILIGSTFIILSLLLMAVLCVNCAHASTNSVINDKKAILAILGEAEGQSSDGMVAIGCAIRNRGNFKGVYGLHSPRVVNKLYSKQSYNEAVTAWKASSNPVVCRELIGNATGWGNSDDMYKFDRMSWFKKCHATKQVGEHYFYVCKEGK